MVLIGEFAGLTGLSVKALRHYDERGVLVPAEVDVRSGYRRYAESQVRDGVVIRALRDAGVPLPEVAAVVRSGASEQALSVRRARVLAEREREDAAFAAATGVLRALAVPVDVQQRSQPAQPFVARALAVPADDVDALSDDDADDAFGTLFAEVQAAGLGPTGPFWTALRADGQGAIEVLCCWPTSSPAPADGWSAPTVTGMLPARAELVASWGPTTQDLPEGSLHPAVVALFDVLAETDRQISDMEVRQSVRGLTEHDQVVEVAVTLA